MITPITKMEDHDSPPTQSSTTPIEPLVHSLVQRYQSVEILHPILQTLFESTEQKILFTAVTQHDYDVFKSRSQKLADHEINAYQKAFCVLMENEDDRVGGLEIYVEKILGVDGGDKGGEEGEEGEWVAKGVAVRALLAHGMSLPIYTTTREMENVSSKKCD